MPTNAKSRLGITEAALRVCPVCFAYVQYGFLAFLKCLFSCTKVPLLPLKSAVLSIPRASFAAPEALLPVTQSLLIAPRALCHGHATPYVSKKNWGAPSCHSPVCLWQEGAPPLSRVPLWCGSHLPRTLRYLSVSLIRSRASFICRSNLSSYSIAPFSK